MLKKMEFVISILLALCSGCDALATNVDALDAAHTAKPDDATATDTDENNADAEPAELKDAVLLTNNSGLVQNITTNQLDLSWRANANAADKMVVERRLNADAFQTVATLAGNATGFHDSGLKPGDQYEYRVSRKSGNVSELWAQFLGIRTIPGGEYVGTRDSVNACTTWIDPTVNLHKALANSKADEVLCFAAGAYTVYGAEPLVFSQGRSFYAEAGAMLSRKGNGTEALVTIASNVKVNGFTFNGQGVAFDKNVVSSQLNENRFNDLDTAILANSGQHLWIEGNIFKNITHGMVIAGTIDDVIFNYGWVDGLGTDFIYGKDVNVFGMSNRKNRINSWRPTAGVARHIPVNVSMNGATQQHFVVVNSVFLTDGLPTNEITTAIYFNADNAYIHGNSIVNYKVPVIVDKARTYEMSYSVYCGYQTPVQYTGGAQASATFGTLTLMPSCNGFQIPNTATPGT